MKLKEIGEFGFIERFKPLFKDLVGEGQTGIGDDCAILPCNEYDDWLVTTDLLIEDVHFLKDAIAPELLGHKSLAVNLSDIAAMGGTPVGTFLSIAIPPDTEVEYLDAFMDGYHKLSELYHTPLLGGDTTKSVKHLAINVCVIGRCPKGQARKRSMARVGDVVCVTGYIGDSAGGLHVLLNKLPSSTEHEYLLLKHHRPTPRVNEGLFLANEPAVHAMTDISDGIASDLVHILKASGVSANIHLDALPVSGQLNYVAEEQGWNKVELAVGGGEDYELLFTVPQTEFESVSRKFYSKFGIPIRQIGYIVDGNPEIQWFNKNKKAVFSKIGFNHFQ